MSDLGFGAVWVDYPDEMVEALERQLEINKYMIELKPKNTLFFYQLEFYKNHSGKKVLEIGLVDEKRMRGTIKMDNVKSVTIVPGSCAGFVASDLEKFVVSSARFEIDYIRLYEDGTVYITPLKCNIPEENNESREVKIHE